MSWWRRFNVRIGLPSLILSTVVVIVFDVTWLYVLFGVMVVLWCADLMRLTRDIRRARRAEHGE